MNNFEEQHILPYIILGNPPCKLLIDTGASCSLLDPKFIDKNCDLNACVIENRETIITSATGERRISQVIHLPLFQNYNSDEVLAFKILDYHKYFDGILGMDILSKLGADIRLNDG